jgi:hypothetical protein
MLKLIVTEKTYPKDSLWYFLAKDEMKNLLCSIDTESDVECQISGDCYEEYKFAYDTKVKFYNLTSSLIKNDEPIEGATEKDISNDHADISWLGEEIACVPELFRQRFKDLEPGSYLLETRWIGDDEEEEIKIVGIKKEILNGNN